MLHCRYMTNPIKQLNEKVTYEEMAKRTKLHVQSIYELSNKTPEAMLKIEVKTAILFKEKFNISLWDYAKSK